MIGCADRCQEDMAIGINHLQKFRSKKYIYFHTFFLLFNSFIFFCVFSGVLDTASRQLDQMIDQARYRHHQHRSKFKEAIDYLDQIFEDLKKEVEPPTSISSEHKTEIPPPLSTKGIQAAKAIFQKPAATVPQQPQQQPLIGGSQANNVPIVRLR